MDRAGYIEVLSRHWVHSHEEDSETEMVFRPATYGFPPSRGRKSFKLRQDGSMVEIGLGATDRPHPEPGTWEIEGASNLVFHPGPEAAPERVLQIVYVDKDRLVVRK